MPQVLQDLNWVMRVLDHQQIKKKGFREAFNEFSEVYGEVALDIKRRLLNVVGEEIRCTMKRKENTGENVFNVRGDGLLKRGWGEVNKKRAQPAPVRLV